MKNKLILSITLTFLLLLLALPTTAQITTSNNLGISEEAQEIPRATLSATVYTKSGDGIITDTSDYAPGDSVVITGTGFWPNESVAIEIVNVYNPGYGDSDGPWYISANEVGDIETFWIVPNEGVDQTYEVIAIGQESDITLSATFTDANTLLELTVLPFDTTCAGTDVTVCGYLTQNCGGGNYAPLPNRPILFFINAGNCGNDVAINADDTVWTDENGLACATLTVPVTAGTYAIRIKFVGEEKPGYWDPPNSACDPSHKTKLSASNECEDFIVANTYGNAPTITIVNDTTVTACGPETICLPILVEDDQCDIDTVYSNIGDYAGTTSNVDQLAKINALGGTVTQIGGGAPGATLYEASDFVAPINALSGVSVTLPNFIFASSVNNYGSFPSGIGPAQSADQLLGSPTDLTFTLPGAGGPDGGMGDGSVDFSLNNFVCLEYNQSIMTCNGSNSDLIFFTNTGSGGTANIVLKYGGDPVYVHSEFIPSNTAGSGLGSTVIDLPDGITFDVIKITCASGTLELDAVAARILPSGSADDLCFMADTSGVYEVTVTAIDKCGNSSTETAYVTVSVGAPPVADAGADFTKFICASEEVCFDVSFTDPDNNIATTALISGPGALVGSQICFTPPTAGVYNFVIKATDSCGATDYDTVAVTIQLNNAPIANSVPTQTLFQCTPEEVCYVLTATDPEGGPLTWSLLNGAGSVTTGGQYCLTPTISGTYNANVIVSDSCGLADTIGITYNITLNSKPVATDPASPVDLFQCTPEEICYQFAATDANGGTLNWSMLSGAGTLSTSGLWCFTPTADGAYSVMAVVTDSCGAADTTSLTYNITLNTPPQISAANDTTYDLCQSAPICFDYTVSDAQGLSGLVEGMVSGYGTLDSAANSVCFTPTTAGCYEFILSVTDDCGESALDTVEICVTFGASAQITCPTEPIDISLCQPDQVCQMIAISPATATVTPSFGTYSGGQLCFDADTAGTYIISLIAEEACGADTCEITFNVDINVAAQITCPTPQTLFLCEAGQVCSPIGINGTNVVVTVSPIGTYGGGQLCFDADSSGHYELEVIATSDCGADTCTYVADITINSAPIAVDPGSPIDTFMCGSAEVCYQFSAADVNSNIDSWTRLSGNGTVSPSGEWCFTPGASGTYTVTAAVTDACGDADTVSMTYNVTFNSKPIVNLGADTTVFLCDIDSVCVPFSTSDVDDNISTLDIISGPGTAYGLTSEVCFQATSVGTYQIVLQVTDVCGATDVDTINVSVEFNNAPLVDGGSDQNLFLCDVQQLCWTVASSDPDGNLSTVTMLEGPGTFDGTNICFTPDSSWCYEFIFQATDVCGATDVDTVAVCVTYNSAPIATAGADQTLFQCTPTQVCWPASCSDIDGNLANCNLISGTGGYDGSNICFTPDTSGVYSFILEAVDNCGATDRDTVLIDITLNSGPVCNIPNDTTIVQCDPTEVCLPVSGSDVDGNFSLCQIVSGPGTLAGGNWCYTPTTSQSVTVTIKCQDACGAFCQSSFTVDFEVNRDPSIDFATTAPIFLCSPEQICIGYTADDPDANQTATITLVAGSGTLDTGNSQVCFTPTATGSYQFIIRIDDPCGAADLDTIDVNVTLNSAPTVTLIDDRSYDLCQSEEICFDASVSDVDLNLVAINLVGTGTFNGSQICFTPATSGVYQFILSGTDACDAESADTVNITVDINSAPTIAFDAASDASLCDPTEICLTYTTGDPDATDILSESMVTGYGTIDTTANQICFTPTTAGAYQFIIEVVDECGAISQDTLEINVTFNDHATIACAGAPIDVSLCVPEPVCYSLAIQPAGATVTTSFGTYSGGELCFDADTSGTYIIEVIADATCSSDTCSLTFNVTIDPQVAITCPAPQTAFACGDVCLPVTVMGDDVTVSVTPLGSYSGGQVCFTPDSSGHYVLELIANSASCGADTCSLEVDVTVNTPPVAVDPPTPVDTTICAAATLTFQFDAGDVDGQDLIWTKLSGNGSITSAGLWTFSPGSSGSFMITAVVTDECGTADTTSLTYNIALNQAPIIAFDAAPTDYTLCDATTLCFTYQASDADGDNLTETLLSPYGTIDTVANQVCFNASIDGNYELIVQVEDDCGRIALDTFKVNILMNTPPFAFAGQDATLWLCAPEEICFFAASYDDENNISTLALTSPVGSYDGINICFTPDTAGVYTFIVNAEDACGLVKADTSYITVGLNSPPVCQVPNDTSIFQCDPTQISLPVSGSDPDGNFDYLELLSGPGSLSGGNWVFTPTNSNSFYVKIMGVDECGLECIDSFMVDITINTAPVVDAGEDTQIFLCQTEEICLPVSAFDIDGNLATFEVMSALAYLDGLNNQICFTPDTVDKAYKFILRAIDECGAEDFDTVLVDVKYNHDPEINMLSSYTVYLGDPDNICLNVNSSDPDDNIQFVTTLPQNLYDNVSDQVCFYADTTGEYCLSVTVVDDCGRSVTQELCVTVQIDECIVVQIEQTEPALQGQFETVEIMFNGSTHELGGFDLLLTYDPSALSVGSAYPGSMFVNSDWEYFSYRQGPFGNCTDACPSGMIRIVAIADVNNGAYHPTGFFDDNAVGDIANIDFLVTNDRTMECQFTKIDFFWLDCGDNSFSSRLGDTLWINRDIYDQLGGNIRDDYYGFPGYYGAHADCEIGMGGDKPIPLRCVDYINGGLDIICADEIDDRGDINLNGIAYEIADAVLLSNYFVYGLAALEPNVEAKIAASDVNADGLSLSVADLVYMILVITGDVSPIPKLDPDYKPAADFEIVDDYLVLNNAEAALGAVAVVIEGKADPQLSEHLKEMDMKYHYDGVNTSVVIYNIKGERMLEGEIIKLNGSHKVIEVTAGSDNGYVVDAKFNALPHQFELSQNYPNPFNPTTTIEFALPTESDWEIEIYNVLGQTVDRLADHAEPGYVKIEWDASRYASGVYFYRLTAGKFSATKKMVLLK